MTAYEHTDSLEFIPNDLRHGTPADEAALVELSVILPTWQMEALEKAARGRGVTTAQMMRRVIGDFFSELPTWKTTLATPV